MNHLARLAAELEAAADRLPSDPDSSPAAQMLEELTARFADWRQRVLDMPEGELRDRVIWALMGAERHLRPERDVAARADAPGGRLRLEAAARTLREMMVTVDPPPVA